MNLLIQNGIIVHGQEGEHQKADILIRDGVVVEVGDGCVVDGACDICTCFQCVCVI